MRIKVGDRVRILDGRKKPDIYPKWVKEMDELIGTVRTVDHAAGSVYGLFDTDFLFAEEWLAPAEFTKDDLREFDIVEFRSGRKLLVTMDLVSARLDVGGYTFGTWDDDLKDNTCAPQYDIMKVYRPTDSIPTDKSKWIDLPLIYERTEVKEMTVEEISKALGYEVKVVK